eukprot:CAMPEP_0172434576 /NCGR_PEP_ID=MMETSP1064-20121228/70708_1 /TAXON_ID=202472 /ORGANISM="Aulacoseira subarctica , Strain CCAP 1002/5" /LENGTH=65 /DNA_ID=CAMNT_0013182809 /DNA_START=63 /DNA_END=263 /DNA_ORIENTATION=+
MSTPTTFWRLAGMSYTQYIMRATQAMRSALKEPAKSRAVKRDECGFTRQIWEEGKAGKKVRVGNN